MKDPIRVLVTGSRHVSGSEPVYIRNILRTWTRQPRLDGIPVVIVQGECPYGGVDLVAKKWAESCPGVTSEGYPPNLGLYGTKGFSMRNTTMVNRGAHVCLAFPGPASKGTWDCLMKAAKAGIVGHTFPIGLGHGVGDDEEDDPDA